VLYLPLFPSVLVDFVIVHHSRAWSMVLLHERLAEVVWRVALLVQRLELGMEKDATEESG